MGKMARKRLKSNRAAKRKITEVTMKRDFDQRQADKVVKVDAQEKEKDINGGRKEKRKIELNIRNGTYQVIKNTDKIRRWNKKARKQLVKMSPEMTTSLIEKKG